MRPNKFPLFLSILSLLVLTGLACGFITSVVATPTAAATETPVVLPPTSTKTPKPTSTPRPTITPDIAATQKYDEFNALLEKIEGEGRISTTVGKTVELDPFQESWAQMNWFQFWPVGAVDSEFVFKANFNWVTASSTPAQSGCGIIFGGQENGDYYAVFLTNDNIRFFMKRGANLYTVGKTSGSGVYKFSNPAEAEFVLAVSDQKAYILVDGEPTLYTLSMDQTAKGDFGVSLLSGTNKDYGTRCGIDEMFLWNNTNK